MLFHPMHDYYGTGDWLWSIFSTALFIGLFVAAIMLLVRVFSSPRHQGPGQGARSVGGQWPGPGGADGTRPGWRSPEAEGAERILAERYARGEISEEEYRGRLEVLRQAAANWAQQAPQSQSRPQSQPHWQSWPSQSEAPPQQPVQAPESEEQRTETTSKEGDGKTGVN